MKKTLYILLIILVACKSKQEIVQTKEITQTNVFKHPKYKTLQEFKGDSLSYLQTNFLEHQDFYIGKPLNVLLKDLELEIKDYTYGSNAKNINISPNLSLNFYNGYQKRVKIKNKENPLVLYVVWQTPMPYNKILELLRKNDGKWTEEEKEYYGQHIIKEIGMVVPNY